MEIDGTEQMRHPRKTWLPVFSIYVNSFGLFDKDALHRFRTNGV